MEYQNVSIDPSNGPVGAEVSGLDLSQTLDAPVVDELRRAWLQHKVLFFRDQDLTPSQQADFSGLFGELDVYPFMKSVDNHPNVIPIIKEPDAKLNFGGAWHTDTSYQDCPPKATLLYAIDVPDEGGDTLFADTTRAFEELSDGFRQTLMGLTGIYSPKIVHGSGGAYDQQDARENLGTSYGGDANLAEQEVEHPLIRTHDETGAKSIYCGLFHAHRIKGWTREESLPIFQYLSRHMTQERFVTRFKWRKGSLAMWDNRCLFHNALNDYEGHRRHMHRVIVKGERPV